MITTSVCLAVQGTSGIIAESRISGLDPTVFAFVVRATVLIMNLWGWAMVRGIEGVYRQTLVRAILDCVLWQTFATFALVGVEIASTDPRTTWIILPSLLVTLVCWVLSFRAMVGLAEELSGQRYPQLRPRIWVGGAVLMAALLTVGATQPLEALGVSQLLLPTIFSKTVAQLSLAAMLWTLVPRDHPRRRIANVMIWVLIAMAMMRPLYLIVPFNALASPMKNFVGASEQLKSLLLVMTFNGAISVGVVGLCLRLSRSDFEVAAARAVLVERLAAGRRADADAGQFAVTVAHDLKNVLQATSVVAAELRHTPHGRDKYGPLAVASHRLSRKLNRLLEFARTDPAPPTLVEMSQFLERMRPILDTLFAERQLRMSLSDVGLLVRVDEEALERMVVELCEQAREHTLPRGVVTVQLLRQAAAGFGLHDDMTVPHVAAGDYACLAVIDSGAPVTAAELATIFEPRLSDDDGARGGLGLAWVRAHANSIGGDLSVDTARDTGAAIRLWIPLVKG